MRHKHIITMCDGITRTRRASLLGLEVGRDKVPVDQGGEEVGHVGGAHVLVVEVVGVLPDVHGD